MFKQDTVLGRALGSCAPLTLYFQTNLDSRDLPLVYREETMTAYMSASATNNSGASHG